MKLIDSMTVKLSWGLVLLAFTLLILFVGGLSLYASHYSRSAFGTLNHIHVEQTTALHRAYINALQAQVAMDRAAELIRVPSFDEPGPVIEQAQAFMVAARSAFQRFIDAPAQPRQAPAIKALSDTFASLMNTGLTLQLALLEDGDFAGYRSGRSRLNNMGAAFMGSADGFLHASEQQAGGLVASFERMVARLDLALAGTVAVALALVALVLWKVTANVIRPLGEMVGHFRRIAAGDLSEPLPKRGGNEIGQLYQGLATMQGSLAELVGQVRASGAGIDHDSARIARGNAELSRRFDELAAAQEQTAASVEQITATVKQTEQHAHQADRLAGDAREVAVRGDQAVHQVVAAMQRIGERATDIGGIGGAIEALATQTRLLALNAAVESARAGEHGRGFAVVAAEVRTLAENSTRLVGDINRLVADALAEADQGAERARHAGHTMEEMKNAAAGVSTIMAEIALAAGEQSHGVEQIGVAMVRIDEVTRDNARLVRQAADAGESLEQQVRILTARVETVVLADQERHRDAPPPLLGAPEPTVGPAVMFPGAF
ncbi:methyl-accepting chemotaxis protein [Alcanivorax sp. N3-2A]|nr:methyl-accepting chemotaxis protein [Alcanivorax sp. N3-2A]|tara:strand:- start:30703 stop:32349 length:1647 start_codon:yes stop_codon:yes gene_type:complete